MIRFKELRLKNFTRLKEATVKFSDDPKKPLTLIYGPNGSGKTTIMRAITWALHGTTNDPVFNTYKKLLNRDAEKKGDLNFSVTLIIENGDELIDIERSYNIKKGISEPKSENDFEETLSVTKNGDVEPSGNAQPEIEKLFPLELLDFYFFDGEDLGEYQEHMNNERNFIKNKIERVTKIPELIQLENCLNKVKDILDERLSNSSEDVDLNRDIGELNTKINENKDKKETAEGLIADYKEEIRKLESDFTDNDEETVDAIDKAEDKILNLTKELAEVKVKLLESTNNLWIFPIKKKLEKYRSKSKGIFSQVEHDQLASLLDYSSESKECPLCNRVHTKDTQEHIEKTIYELEDKKDKYNIKYKSI